MKSCLARTIATAVAVVTSMEAGVAVEMTEVQGSWRLVEAGGQAVEAADNTPHFTIEGGRITGFDGCNQFSGPLDDPQMMIVGQRACAGEFVKLPLDLSDPKGHLAQASLEGDRLTLPARGDRPASTFEQERQ